MGLVVPFLLVLGACDSATDDPATQSPRDPPVSAVSAAPPTVYQADSTVWVRPSGSDAVVDVGSGLDGVPQHPDWSPDGLTLVVETDFASIWTMAADGSDPVRLYDCTRPCVVIQDPSWSPDGRQVVFKESQSRDGEVTSRELLRVIDVAEGDVRTVRTDRTGRIGFYNPRWSDDDGSLVYEEDVFASARVDETVVSRFRVVTIGADGRDRRVLASWRGPFAGPGSPAPDWSGVRVVYARNDNLVVMDLQDGSVRQLTSYNARTEHAIQPTFTPDGTQVVFTYVEGTFGVDDHAQGAVLDLETGVVSMLDLPGATHVRIAPP